MKNYLDFYDYALWTLGVAIQVWILWKLSTRNRTAFEYFLFFSVAKSICLWLVSQMLSVQAYCYAYVWFSVAGVCIETLVLLQMINGLRKSAAIPTETFRCFLLYSLGLLGVLICLSLYGDIAVGANPYQVATRLVILTQAAVFVSVVSFSAVWGMAWLRESGIIAGFGIIALIELVVAACESHSKVGNFFLYKIHAVGQILGFIAWVKAVAADSAYKREIYFGNVDVEKLLQVMTRLKIDHVQLRRTRTLQRI